MPRGSSPTHDLAKRFVKEILGRDFDYRFDARWMAEAKRLINPKKDGEKPLDVNMVWGTLQCLKLGMFGNEKPVESMWAVTWGTPSYYSQYLEYYNSPPPCWNKPEVEQWEKITGKVAYPPEENCAIIESVPALPPKSSSDGSEGSYYD